MVHAQQNVINY